MWYEVLLGFDGVSAMDFSSLCVLQELPPPPPTLIWSSSFPDLCDFHGVEVGADIHDRHKVQPPVKGVTNCESADSEEEVLDVLVQVFHNRDNLPATIFVAADNKMTSEGGKRATCDSLVPEEHPAKKYKGCHVKENAIVSSTARSSQVTPLDAIEQQFVASLNKAGVTYNFPRASAVPAQSEVVSTLHQQSSPGGVLEGVQLSQETEDMQARSTALGQALSDGVKSLEHLSSKVKQLCDSEGITLPPSAVDVMMRALNPTFMSTPVPQSSGVPESTGREQLPRALRLIDTPGRWPVKRNKSVTWGEDGELWLMRQLVEWGSNTCDNPREKAQMNKDLVAAMQREFGLSVDANCVKNKQRDLEDSFQNFEKVRKSISGLGWQDSQVAWDPEVWEEFKRSHPHRAADLDGHKRLFTSEKYKLMSTLWGGKTRATGAYDGVPVLPPYSSCCHACLAH